MTCDACNGTFTADELVPIGGKNVCAKCKPDLVMNLKSGVGAAPHIDPLKAKEIKGRISRLNLMSFVLAIPGMILQGATIAMPEPQDGDMAGGAIFLLLLGGGLVLIIWGFVYYARMKGRSGLFGLLGLVSCLGLIILHFLSKSCQNCSSSAGHAAKECSTCGGPV
jgi:hypothetical protein